MRPHPQSLRLETLTSVLLRSSTCQCAQGLQCFQLRTRRQTLSLLCTSAKLSVCHHQYCARQGSCGYGLLNQDQWPLLDRRRAVHLQLVLHDGPTAGVRRVLRAAVRRERAGAHESLPHVTHSRDLDLTGPAHARMPCSATPVLRPIGVASSAYTMHSRRRQPPCDASRRVVLSSPAVATLSCMVARTRPLALVQHSGRCVRRP